jgi:hypothetical protein
VFADGGYAGKLVEWAKEKANLVLSIVKPEYLKRRRCVGVRIRETSSATEPCGDTGEVPDADGV